MDFKDLFIVFIISLADMVTTHMSMVIFNSCSLERNHLIISLCEVIGYGATWIWLPIEFTVITLVYEGLKKLRKILGAGIKAEKNISCFSHYTNNQ
jgi:hypothetical protein